MERTEFDRKIDDVVVTLRGTLSFMEKDPNVVDEIIATVVQTAMEKCDRISTSLEGYLFCMARDRLKDYWKKRSRERQYIKKVIDLGTTRKNPHCGPLEKMIHDEEREICSEVLSTCTQDERTIIHEYLFSNNRNTKELAEKLGMSVSELYRAAHKLKKRLTGSAEDVENKLR